MTMYDCKGCLCWRWGRFLRVVMLLGCFLAPGDTSNITEQESVPTIGADAVQTGLARLPCDITAPPGDKLRIVIWYKNGRTIPIYSFDTRNSDEGVHWADELLFGGRAFFQAFTDPAALAIESTKGSDSGVYRCRVDFQKSPTRNTKVNLTVIIPPEKLSILDEYGTHIPHYILGPYNEGAIINITCVATGGKPTPRVSWWQENTFLDDTFSILSERRVKNVLRLERLQRKHLHSVFTCQASNNNVTAPISSAVTLDMNLRPLSIKLLGENQPLSAEHPYEISCEVIGSRPAPTITWWKGSVAMRTTREITSADGNSTISILSFVPSIEDSGKYLSCRGVQSLIPDSALEDGWKLNIYHVPIVTLDLGSNLNGSIIREGDDVYFECNIKSNPWVYKVSWEHNGEILYNNIPGGIIVSNQSLVLQNIGRARAGLYTCMGSNQEGVGTSNAVQLDIKYAPVCRPGQPRAYGVGRQELVRISCELEANPPDVTFIWRFNNSNAETIDLSPTLISTDKSRSVAAYTPMTEQDYGTLLCWGNNEVGGQIDPCVFFVSPAGKPDPLSNCSIINQTAEALTVDCLEGFDGGLPQEFIMEVYIARTHQLVSSVTTKNPYFSVFGLDSGLELDIILASVNKKGRSDLYQLHAYTLKPAEKHTEFTPSILNMTPFLGALIGAVSSVIILAIVIVLVIRFRHNAGSGGGSHCTNSVSGGFKLSPNSKIAISSKNNSKESLNSLDENNPDIIPQGNGEDDGAEDEKAFEWLNNAPQRIYTTTISRNNTMMQGHHHPSTITNQYPSVQDYMYPHGCVTSKADGVTQLGLGTLQEVPRDSTLQRMTPTLNPACSNPYAPRSNDGLTYAELSLGLPQQNALYTNATLCPSRHTLSGTLISNRTNASSLTHLNEPTVYAQLDVHNHQISRPVTSEHMTLPHKMGGGAVDGSRMILRPVCATLPRHDSSQMHLNRNICRINDASYGIDGCSQDGSYRNSVNFDCPPPGDGAAFDGAAISCIRDNTMPVLNPLLEQQRSVSNSSPASTLPVSSQRGQATRF